MSICNDNHRLGLVGCGASYNGRQQHSVARVSWSDQPDGRAHLTFTTEANVDKCWKGDTMRHPTGIGLVANQRGVWHSPQSPDRLNCEAQDSGTALSGTPMAHRPFQALKSADQEPA